MEDGGVTTLNRLLREYTTTFVPPDMSELKKCLTEVTLDQRYDLLATVTERKTNLNAVHISAFKNHLETLQCVFSSLDSSRLLCLLKTENSKGCTPLSRAALLGHTSMVKYMLDNVEAQDRFELLKHESSFGTTALHVAVRMGNSKTTLSILENVEEEERFKMLMIKDNKNRTVIHVGIEYDQITIVHCMLDMITPEHQIKLLEIRREPPKKNSIEQSKNFDNEELFQYLWENMEFQKKKEKITSQYRSQNKGGVTRNDIDKEQRQRGDVKLEQAFGCGSLAAVSKSYCNRSVTPDSRSSVSEVIEGGFEQLVGDEGAIPDDLIQQIDKMCEAHGVVNHTLLQNPKDLKNIAVIGENNKCLPKEELLLLSSKFEGYSIFVPENCEKSYTKHLTWKNSFKIEKFGLQSAGRCELLAQARDDADRETLYAAGPAHLVIQNDEMVGDIADEHVEEAHERLNSFPSETVYHFRTGTIVEGAQMKHEEEGEHFAVPTNHPPLFGFRYNYEVAEQAGQPANDTMQPEGEAERVRSEHCRTDMVLLPFDSRNAANIQRKLKHYKETRQNQLVNISTRNKLMVYNRPIQFRRNIPIAIKGFFGHLCNNFHSVSFQRANGIGHDLLFTLEQGTLVAGDSGSILFEIGSPDQHYPLGMLVGLGEPSVFPGEVYYKAFILERAIKDLQERYPQQLREIKLCSLTDEPQQEVDQVEEIDNEVVE